MKRLLLLLFTAQIAHAEFSFEQNDTVLLYGNSMIELLMEHGEMEARVHLAFPGKNLHFRSFAWTGDEIANRLRAEGYAAHMKDLLTTWPADVVILGYGMNESFAGEMGLPAFRSQLESHLDQLARLHRGAKFVLLSPIANENDAERTSAIKLYAKAIADVAKSRNLLFVDLFTASQTAYAKSSEPLTTRGLHLNDEGNQAMAEVIAHALGVSSSAQVDRGHLHEVAAAAGQLAYFVAEVVRPKNGILYYGQRKRPEERASELPLYLQRIEKADTLVHEIASKPGAKFSEAPFIALTPLPPVTSGGSTSGVGIVKNAAETQAELKLADGYSLNLFASDEQFPELRAPVQIAFDARGRLWVVTMPSFPHTVPGQPQEDKLLILEDTDHDGRADVCKTFASGFDALDGVSFTENGALVGEQSRHWLLRDTNGDDQADTKSEALRGLDVTDSHHGGMVATDPLGGVWFSDGVFHRSQFETPFGVHRGFDASTYRLNPRNGRIETEWQSITPNPWRVTFDRTGNAFQMYGDGLVLDGLALTWTPFGVYHPFQHGLTVGYGKGSAAASISSPNFPDDYQQGMVSAACIGPYAVSLTKYDFSQGLVKGSGRLDVVTSANPAFRPVDVNFGFDGALYISDFSSAIIGHAQNPMRDARWNHTRGRIWRVEHNGKPVVKDWPKIEGSGAPQLCSLLKHPQDIVRHHARIELRRSGASVLTSVDAWVADNHDDQSILEALFVCEGLAQTRPALLEKLLSAESPLHRAAAVHLLRMQADQLPDVQEWLDRKTADSHPRVRMEVVDAIAHLRPRFPFMQQLLPKFQNEQNEHVKRMLADLAYGTTPRLGSSVPVLEIFPESKLSKWNDLGGGKYQTFIHSDHPQAAVLALRYSFLDVSLNGVQTLSFDSQWSSEQQARLELQSGLNTLEIIYRRLNGAPPEVFLFNPTGEKLTAAQTAQDDAQLAAFTANWEKMNAELGWALRVQAVPGQMQFSPRELRVEAGTKVRLIFDNPDLMLHNLLVLSPGSLDEIGKLADKLASDPNFISQAYVPTSPKVLYATALAVPNTKVELTFDAPNTAGSYPYVCTFPGHWQLMNGALIVHAPSSNMPNSTDQMDAFERHLPASRLTPASISDHASNAGGGKDATALFNATTRNGLGGADTMDDGKTFRGYGKGDSLTIQFDLTQSPKGYDLTQILSISSHSDGRASQHYQLYAATAKDPGKFHLLDTVKIETDSGATAARYQAKENMLGIAVLRMDFTDGPVGYNVYREIAIQGTPAAK